jgi:S1-C subfamily serine protease
MLRALLAAMLTLAVSPALALTPKEVAEKLGASVVGITYKGQTICSAAKIGPAQFLTAQHCLMMGEAVKLPSGRLLRIKSILTSFETKKQVESSARDRQEDWAILNTVEDDLLMPALELGCEEEVYLTQEVAYAGFPYPTQYALGFGRVTSLKPTYPTGNNLDYIMDVHAAPGSSGSAVISVDTGRVIGILTEGVFAKIGAFMVGFESVKNLDQCGAPAQQIVKAPTADALEK